MTGEPACLQQSCCLPHVCAVGIPADSNTMSQSYMQEWLRS